MSRVTFAFLILVLAPGSGAAQSQDCGYTACALRVRFGILGGQSLIRAESGEKVRGVGFPVAGLDQSFAGSPLAQDLARTYQSRTNIGTSLVLAGFVSFLVWFLDADNLYGDVDYGWMFIAAPLTAAGSITVSSGRDYLSRAVWEYNKSLIR